MAEMSVAATGKIAGAAPLAEPKKAVGAKNGAPVDAFKQMLANEAEKAKAAGETPAVKAADANSAAKLGVKGGDQPTEKPVLKFSNHALERMNSRGIFFTPEQITAIETAAGKAGQKGAKEALVLSDDKALIVSLKNNTIVTVMDKEALKDNVFTNIDSTVFA